MRHLKIFKRLSVLSLLTATMLITAFSSLFIVPAAQAASSSGFQSGRIIDDGIFFNSGSMSTGDIQAFLNSKMPNCDTNHAGSGSNQPPFTCLRDYSQNVTARSADAYCAGALGGGVKSAAQIIKDVGSACGINPQVLIVLLQKEQALVTDTWPWNTQYSYATGYACSDSAPCDPDFAGFSNQLWWAARQFQRYVKQPGSFNYAVGRTSFVAYQANNPGCGGSNITMQNQATAALYNYTPYQPNVAALNNLYGTGDGCSAYGNRNFWRLFNDWFGPTTSSSDANTVSFVRLNHGSGRAELIGVSSISSYQTISRNNLTGYPAVPADGNVIPITATSISSVSFIRLNHSSGRSELATFSSESGFQHNINYHLTAYPAVANDGAVIPLFSPDGNLSFIRLNHSSGRVEIATFSWQSNYQHLVNYQLTAYPAVAGDGSVVPVFQPNGDLSFIRLNHSSGRIEIATFAAGYFQRLANYKLVGYPAVAGDGAVTPLITPAGNLAFVRLNFWSGRSEIATFSAASGYQNVSDYQLTAYPAISDIREVKVLISR